MTPSTTATLATITALGEAAQQLDKTQARFTRPEQPKARRPAEVRNKRKQQKESRRRNRR